MTRLFVTATGTDIGKTFVTAALACQQRRRGRSVRAIKPIASGFDPAQLATSDTGILLAAQGLAVTPEAAAECSPWRFSAPLSPDMAAAREGRTIDVGALVAWCRGALAGPEDAVLIEGIGGVMVPLDDSATVLDWIAALGIPALLVAGSYLGTLSHTLTALAVLRQRGVAVRAIVIDETPGSPAPLDDTAVAVARFAADVPVVPLTRCADWRTAPDLSACG